MVAELPPDTQADSCVAPFDARWVRQPMALPQAVAAAGTGSHMPPEGEQEGGPGDRATSSGLHRDA